MNCSPPLEQRLRSYEEALAARQYPPSPTQQIRALIEAAEKQIHRVQDEVGGNTEAERDVYVLCKEMLGYTKELVASYVGQLEEAVALVATEKALTELERKREAG